MGLRMRRLSIAIVAVVAACAPVAAGPELPRPALPAGSPPPTTAPTTTVAAPVTTAASTDPTCPTEFCVLYTIHPQASWTDGTPVTGEDFVRTYQQGRFAGVPGYDTIVSVEVIEPKQVFVTFSGPYGAWLHLFARLIGQGGAQSTGYELVDQVPGDSIVVSRVEGGGRIRIRSPEPLWAMSNRSHSCSCQIWTRWSRLSPRGKST